MLDDLLNQILGIVEVTELKDLQVSRNLALLAKSSD
jgi:hypothetical protein